ncbi:MAG: MaoC family dehydratase [Dehalococcoidia bacterium]|nr:MaoC family dehydratase [Dehalococcoidia bacterium]
MAGIKPGWQGRYLEDFEVGDVYRCRYGRTITEAENIQFTLLSNNTNQIHFNRDYGERSGFGGCLVNSLLTLSVVVGMGSMDISENGINLGFEDVRFTTPVYGGDTLYTDSEVISVRESQSRPTQGIVSVRTRGYNQKGQTVIEFRRNVMVWKRDHAPGRDIFPTLLS